MIEFSYSDLATALATIITGLGAWGVYAWKKSDDKKNAAMVILTEIRNAEDKIKILKNTKDFSEIAGETWLLLSNNWQKYNHLFINDLDRDEFESINSFYNQCIIIDKQINLLYEIFSESLNEKTRVIQQKAVEFIFKKEMKDEDVDKFEKAIHTASGADTQFIPDSPKAKISKALYSIDSIINSTCGQKLKKLAKSS